MKNMYTMFRQTYGRTDRAKIPSFCGIDFYNLQEYIHDV